MSEKPFQEDGKFTQVHNYVFDMLMPCLSPNAFKVLSYIIRNTKGRTDKNGNRVSIVPLSYDNIREGTGIGSNTTLRESLKELRAFHIVCITEGQEEYEANSYSINERYEAVGKEALQAIQAKVKADRKFNQEGSTETVPTTETVTPPTTETVKNIKKERIKKEGVPPHAFVTMFKDVFHRSPNRLQLAMIQEVEVTDTSLSVWKDTLELWALSGWSPTNVRGMLDKFKKDFDAQASTQMPEYQECLGALQKVNEAIVRDGLGEPLNAIAVYAHTLCNRGETLATIKGAWLKVKVAEKPVGAFVKWIKDNYLINPQPQLTPEQMGWVSGYR